MTDTPILSSRRYKKNIANVPRLTVNELDHIEVKSFNYITDAEDAQMQYGVIAEDIANINPNLVQYDEQGQPKTVYYHLLVPLLLAYVQNLKKEIETLKQNTPGTTKSIYDILR
jgi:hypothetical protein